MTSGSRTENTSGIPRQYLTALLLRGVAFWLLSRIMIVMIATFIAAMTRIEMISMDDAMSGTNAIVAMWTILMAATLTILDLRRRNEVSLLNNLGVTAARAVFVATLPSAIVEAVLLAMT